MASWHSVTAFNCEDAAQIFWTPPTTTDSCVYCSSVDTTISCSGWRSKILPRSPLVHNPSKKSIHQFKLTKKLFSQYAAHSEASWHNRTHLQSETTSHTEAALHNEATSQNDTGCHIIMELFHIFWLPHLTLWYSLRNWKYLKQCNCLTK